ncbi:hypothetical protein SAMN05444008_10950 [Cnuella takakiae]|uniref:Uncharacterized protein n=1 Tax=Cnuella takakiae TaxID=1302690 RepID=A0A1M5CGE6_9BACT|nr:hypothetical protein [Cnuella takakiae]OLY91802.1 hypothetical protein BUE76_07735 [Cnuella takakiae]SHF53472.1 hypothetical protein SAMN05444008_10950 [Cnuella takakiae]
MERNNGMRPQDVVILLKILLWQGRKWLKKDLAAELYLSPAEVGHSLNRSQLAGLVDPTQKKLMKKAFAEFLLHGFAYVFPVKPGSMAIGIPTAYSAPVLNQYVVSSETIVWPHPEGRMKGQSVSPLYKGAIQASLKDKALYDLLCLCDVLRVGRVREKQKAKELLESQISQDV